MVDENFFLKRNTSDTCCYTKAPFFVLISSGYCPRSLQWESIVLACDKYESPNLNVVSLAELHQFGITVRDILSRIRELDHELYSQTCQGVGSLRQWLPIFSQNPETWRAVLAENRDLAAYWQTAVVEDDLYFGLKSGMSGEAKLLASPYKNLTQRGVYNLYFVSICVSPRFRGVETNLALIESFFSVLDRLAGDGVFFKEITGSVCSPDGEQICRTFRLDYLRDNSIGKIYSGSVGRVIDRFKGPLDARFPRLLQHYYSAGLC